MFWLVLILGVIGAAFYIVDKRIKDKFKSDDKFNPNDWDLPGSIELPAEDKPSISLPIPTPVEKISYEKKPGILNRDRMLFYKALQSAVSAQYWVLTNIKAGDVLAVAAGSNTLVAQVTTKNLAEKQFGFVLCEKDSLAVVCVIIFNEDVELLLVNACESAKLPIVRFRAQLNYEMDTVRQTIEQAIGEKVRAGETPLDVSLETPSSDVLEVKSEEPGVAEVAIADNGIELKFCPKCSAVMLKRKAKNGENAGKMFWLCSTYPNCRGMRPI